MSGGGRRTAIALGAMGFAIGLTVVVALAGALSGPAPSAAPTSTPAASSASEASGQPTVPELMIDCRRETAPLPPVLSTDPCPSAITAVELAVAPVRLPIKALVIEPGPLFCGVVWEGVETGPVCAAPAYRPGQFMHGYVSFVGSDKVAVVMLGLDLPPDLAAPDATRPPWSTTLVTVAVPPPGWVMP